MVGPVRDTGAMIAGMDPLRDPQPYVFCTTDDPARVARLTGDAFALIRETEGVTLILPRDIALAQGFDADMPMSCITLRVHSALDGVGLTAAFATALAVAGIACNMVAGYHHDHAFVPEARADEALTLLQRRAARATLLRDESGR